MWAINIRFAFCKYALKTSKKPTLCRYDNELRSTQNPRENEEKKQRIETGKSKSLHKTMMKINPHAKILAKSTDSDKKNEENNSNRNEF